MKDEVMTEITLYTLQRGTEYTVYILNFFRCSETFHAKEVLR